MLCLNNGITCSIITTVHHLVGYSNFTISISNTFVNNKNNSDLLTIASMQNHFTFTNGDKGPLFTLNAGESKISNCVDRGLIQALQ